MKRVGIVLLVAACWRNEPVAPAPPTAQIYRFQIGALEAVALKDGDIHVPNDGQVLGVGESTRAVGDLLAANGLSRDAIDFSIQPLLVRDGERVLLFDTGAAGASFAVAGFLPASLQLAGVTPAQITDIFISHGDPDHVGGLVTSTHALAFPNAKIHMTTLEWTAMQKTREQPALVDAIAPQVVPFEPGAQLLPEVTAVDTRGHTPGHSSYEIASGPDKLLYIGDTMHHVVASVQRPDWTIGFDGDPAAKPMRLAVLQRAAAEHIHVYAVHFPFPGLGHVQAHEQSFIWVKD